MLNPDLSTRVNIIFDNELMAMIDAEAKKMGVNRSFMVRFCCRQYLQNQKAIQSFTDMIDAYKADQMKKAIDGYEVLRNPNIKR